MNQTNSHSNSNQNKKNKRKNRKKKNKNRELVNGVENQKSSNENPIFNAKPTESQSASSPRPKNLCKNNINFENKRSSGSEFEEFHTPNCEYPEFNNDELMKDNDNSYDKEWDEIGNFNKSNLEGIPEKDNFLSKPHDLTPTCNGLKPAEEESRISSENSFKYKSIQVKKIKKCNGDLRKQFKCNGSISMDENHYDLNNQIRKIVKIEEYEVCHKETTNDSINHNGYVFEQIQSKEDNIEDTSCNMLPFSANENHDLTPPPEDEVLINNISGELSVYHDCIDHFEDHQDKDSYCEEPTIDIHDNDDSKYDEIMDSKECEDVNNEERNDLKENESDENEIVKVDETFEYTNQSSEEELTENISISTTREKHLSKEFVNDENEILTQIVTNNENESDRFNKDYLNDKDMESIPCIDENLEAETLNAPIIKVNISWKSNIKKSLTLGAKDYSNSYRQSATTITNVTSISDENLNLSDENEKRKIKNPKKRNKFVKIIFSKFKKPKVNSSVEIDLKKVPNDEYPLPINNEYFDDASIDCNSRAKSLEIDSNKALKSYDESINNFGDTKPLEDEYCDKFVIYDKINIEKEFEYKVIGDISETENKYLEEGKSQRNGSLIPFVEDNQFGEDKTNSIKSVERETSLEKSKKNKIFTLFSRKKSKNSPKLKLNDVTCEEVRKDYNCCDNKELKDENKNCKPIEKNLELDSSDIIVQEERSSFDIRCDIESFDKSFDFLKEFDKEPNCENVGKEINDEITNLEIVETPDVGVCKQPDSSDKQLVAKTEEVVIHIPNDLSLKIRSRDKFSQIDSPTGPSATHTKSKNEKPKDKHKKNYFTLFTNKKHKKPVAVRKSCSDENIAEEKPEESTRNPKLEIEDHINNFNDVLKSLGNPVHIENEKVVSKNQNGYPLEVCKESLTNKTITFVNDDHLFPDSLTPSKIVHFESKELYDFPFIDDPIIVEQDDIIMFKGESKKPLLLTEFSAPFASLETLFISDQSEDIKMPDKSLSPLRSSKGPLSGLMNLISRSR